MNPEDVYLTFSCVAGRILNRFSKDISLMDSILPLTFMDFYQVRIIAVYHIKPTLSFLLVIDKLFYFLHILSIPLFCFSYFYRTLAWSLLPPLSSLTSSPPSCPSLSSSCTCGATTSARHETSNVSSRQVRSRILALITPLWPNREIFLNTESNES